MKQQSTIEPPPFFVKQWLFAVIVGLYLGIGIGMANYNRPALYVDPKFADIHQWHRRLPIPWEITISLTIGMFTAVIIAYLLYRCRRPTEKTDRPLVRASLFTFLLAAFPAFVLWRWHNDSYTAWFMIIPSIVAQQMVYLYLNPYDVSFLKDRSTDIDARRMKLSFIISDAKLYRTVVAGSLVLLIISSFKISTNVQQLLNFEGTMLAELIRRILYTVLYAFAGLFGGLVPMSHWRLRWLIASYDLIPSETLD